MVLHFTGTEIQAFDRELPASCLVRNELNGWRRPDQVLFEKDGHVVHSDVDGARAYQPRPFPPGRWRVTGATGKARDSVYWPVFITTDAWQWLEYWSLDSEGRYDKPTGERFRGYGYGLHYARLKSGEGLIASRTTLGCQNILSFINAEWLGDRITLEFGAGTLIYIEVPPWDQWKV